MHDMVFGEKKQYIEGLAKIIYRSVSIIYIRGLSTNLFIGVCPLIISEGCPQIKQIYLFWKQFIIHGKLHV